LFQAKTKLLDSLRDENTELRGQITEAQAKVKPIERRCAELAAQNDGPLHALTVVSFVGSVITCGCRT
jgi:hypothetical protein